MLARVVDMVLALVVMVVRPILKVLRQRRAALQAVVEELAAL
jgi:F0F1-type ATP synthase membrane subunit b/b'